MAEPGTIRKRVMEAAISLMDTYFLPTAQRVFGDAAIPKEERDARQLARWIVETKPKTVNVSDIRDEARLPGLRDTNAVKAACRFLSEAHWLTEVEHVGRGRPRGDYAVNPKLWDVLQAAE